MCGAVSKPFAKGWCGSEFEEREGVHTHFVGRCYTCASDGSVDA